jgi:hypothetical protein
MGRLSWANGDDASNERRTTSIGRPLPDMVIMSSYYLKCWYAEACTLLKRNFRTLAPAVPSLYRKPPNFGTRGAKL